MKSKREDVDELEQELEEDCEQELPQFMIRTMCKVVSEGMKQEVLFDGDSPPVEPADPFQQQNQVKSESVQTIDPEAKKDIEVVCNECGRVYATVAELKKHMYCSHWYRRERNKKCDWPNCVKTFIDKNKLEEHKRTHTGEKPLKCLELGCNKSFRKKSALDAHKLVHSGGKPHHCLDCGKTFRHKYSLEEHKLTHSSEKPYQCHECGKTFTLSRYLKNHQITHSGEKPYRCSAVNCGKAYTDSSGLLKHKKTQHKGMLQDEVEVEEQVPAHEEVLLGEAVLVKGEGVVKEEVVEAKDGAECGGMEEDPLRILPEELGFKGEGLVS